MHTTSKSTLKSLAMKNRFSMLITQTNVTGIEELLPHSYILNANYYCKKLSQVEKKFLRTTYS